jgi:hypothetical protein
MGGCNIPEWGVEPTNIKESLAFGLFLGNIEFICIIQYNVSIIGMFVYWSDKIK